MKKIENSFVVTGFVCADAQVRSFEKASVARFNLGITQTTKNGETTNRTTAFISIEAWRKNSNLTQFDLLERGKEVTVSGYFKPEEWMDTETNTKRNRIVFAATHICLPEEQDAAEPQPEPEPAREEKPKKGSRKKGSK